MTQIGIPIRPAPEQGGVDTVAIRDCARVLDAPTARSGIVALSFVAVVLKIRNDRHRTPQALYDLAAPAFHGACLGGSRGAHAQNHSRVTFDEIARFASRERGAELVDAAKALPAILCLRHLLRDFAEALTSPIRDQLPPLGLMLFQDTIAIFPEDVRPDGPKTDLQDARLGEMIGGRQRAPGQRAARPRLRT